MSSIEPPRYLKILVTGATGFVGRALVPALLDRGYSVRACARNIESKVRHNLEYVRCDLLDAKALPSVLAGIDAAYYLVHSLGESGDYRALDRRAAAIFAEAAGAAGLRRIVYLGGVMPRGGPASEHLTSRMEVGEILRGGAVPAVELRAAMIVGVGSASWQIVRDLALRLPIMVLPAWLRSRLSPIALEDVVHALVDALEIPLPESTYFDIPGPDMMSAKEILDRIAALEGRKIPAVSLPWLTPRLSALWLRLVTRADFALARELAFGLTTDLIPEDQRYWELTHYRPKVSFDRAARKALDEERRQRGPGGRFGMLEEALVRRVGPRLRPSASLR